MPKAANSEYENDYDYENDYEYEYEYEYEVRERNGKTCTIHSPAATIRSASAPSS